MTYGFDYKGIKFLLSKKDYKKIETKSDICIKVSCDENFLVYPVYISKQNFDDNVDLLLIDHKNKSHYVYIKDFNRFLFDKTKHKNLKNYFADIVYNVLIVKTSCKNTDRYVFKNKWLVKCKIRTWYN